MAVDAAETVLLEPSLDNSQRVGGIRHNIKHTGSLALVDFSGAVFTCAHFQKIAKISSLCDFYYISEGIP